jgi:nitrogen fixation/metabolism regulation signal transduction histidine kinase
MGIRDISSENTSFNYLRGSADFLNAVLNNISSCVMLLDKDMKLQAFNNAIKTIFSNKPNEHLLYKRCGEAIGCAATVEEEKDCGETSKCSSCVLRKCAIMTYADNVAYYKNRLAREFYRTDSSKELRHLQFSSRCVRYDQDRYVMIIVDDLTSIVNQEKLIQKQKSLLDKLR